MNAWTTKIAGLCVSILAAGQVGLAAGPTLTIRDTIGRQWLNEPIVWELPAAKGDAVRFLRDGRPIAGQLVAAEGGVCVLLVIDQLAKDAATTVTAELGRPGPADTDLKLTEEQDALVLANKFTAVRVNCGGENNLSPILAVRTASGKWTGSGAYETTSATPVSSQTELLEKGPVRLAARVTTTFDNGRTHAVTASLWTGSRSIEVDETFDVGPDDRYRFKSYQNDRDELGWEWWSWYGDRDGIEETHPNNWTFRLGGNSYQPREIAYFGQASTDSDKGAVNRASRGAAISEYRLAHDKDRRLEKYLAGHTQWRPDSVLWYMTSPRKTTGMMPWPFTRTLCAIGATRTCCPRRKASPCARAPTICGLSRATAGSS